MSKFVDCHTNEDLEGKLIIEPSGWPCVILEETETEYRVAEMKLDKHGCYWLKVMDCRNEEFNCRETPFKRMLYFID